MWLQSLGQFFWVFIMSETSNLECYKVMGETLEACSGFCNRGSVALILGGGLGCQGTFCVYDVKPVPIQMMNISTWSIRSGLFSKEGDQHFAHFLFLQRPPSTLGSQPPKLHMWRCLTYPDSLTDMLKRQAGPLTV